MLRAILASLLILTLAACQSDREPAAFDAFNHNKMEVLVRSVQSAKDAYVTADQQIVTSLRRIRQEAWTGADPQTAYDLTRRLLATCESRAHTADRRVKIARQSAREHFEQWGRELEEYQDKTLREESRRSLNDFKQRFKLVVEQMDHATKEMDTVIASVQDQMLFVKHHRNAPALPPRPQPEVDLEERAQAMVGAVRLAVLQAEDFIAKAMVPASRTKAGHN